MWVYPVNTSAGVGDTVSFLAKWTGPPRQGVQEVEREGAAQPVANDTASKTLIVDGPLVPVPDAPPTLDDYLYLFYERAAISEFDGGLSRTAAERQALDAVLTMFEAQGVRTAGGTANGCRT